MRLQHCSVSPDATCHSFYDRAFGVGLFFPLRAFGVLGLRARSSCLQCHPTCNAIRRPASLGAGGSGFRVWGFALSSVQCQPLILHAMPQQGAVVFLFFYATARKCRLVTQDHNGWHPRFRVLWGVCIEKNHTTSRPELRPMSPQQAPCWITVYLSAGVLMI